MNESIEFPEEHGLPPRLPKGGLRVVPLGGLGEIGRNMSVLETEGRLLILDCGVLFPEDFQPGVDLVLPDWSYIADRLDDIEGIILTHGHEDHIGAVPFFLRMRPDIPLLGSQLTLAFTEAKLKEHRITPYTLAVTEGQVEQLGPFECEFVSVNHSIPDAMAVAVKTRAGTVLDTGDFKMDQLPLDNRITDLRAFGRLGEEGVDLLMVDSTNADVPGYMAHEREIGPVLDSVFAHPQGLIVVASFSSHVHRVQQVLDAAAANNRKVAFAGRSMIRNMQIARELGYLDIPPRTMVELSEADKLPRDRVVFMCTGSQGEPMAALSRIANGDHKIHVGEGDTVVLASSLIPGNENSVYRVINELTRKGAKVIHKGNAKVHVSGHATSEELLYFYNVVQPRNVMPIHGEPRHLVANRALAVSTGVPEDNVVLAENGSVIDLVDGRVELVGKVPCGYVYVDGDSVGEVTEIELKDRRILGDEGFISVFAVVDHATGNIVAGPIIQARGMVESDDVFDEVKPEIEASLVGAVASGVNDTHALQQVMRRSLGKWVGRRLRRKPMILPVVVLV